MERSVAVKKLGKLLGKSLGYRIDNKAATREDRAEAQAALKAACAERDALKDKCDARRRAILEADAEHCSLCAAHKTASDTVERLFSITRHHKITVGTSNGMFFLVKAEGDSWEEVIEKLEAETRKGVAA